MKRVFIFLFSLIALNSLAQEFKGGFYAGLTSSQVDGDTYGGFDKTGFTLGVFTSRDISEKFMLQLELQYSQRGSKKNTDEKNGDYTFYKMHLEYFEIPLVAIYKYSEKLSFQAGISGAYLVRAYEDDGYQRYISNPFHKITFSTLIGVKYALTENIVLDLRETYSLRPIRGYAEGNLWIYRFGQYSNSLSFSVNYLF